MGDREPATPWPVAVETASAADTRSAAAALATLARPGDIVLLVGGLGAGKTTFAQGFARALGVRGPVTSPTFTLVRQYRCAGVDGVDQLVHADVYRLDSLAEVEDLAIDELVDDAAVALIEWGDAAAPVLGADPLRVVLTRPGEPGGPTPVPDHGVPDHGAPDHGAPDHGAPDDGAATTPRRPRAARTSRGGFVWAAAGPAGPAAARRWPPPWVRPRPSPESRSAGRDRPRDRVGHRAGRGGRGRR